MKHVIEQMAQQLKSVREQKGLSQRDLSQKAGLPQSHISKIENAGVDLRVSSLIELARALDLELTLVPRKTVPAVQSIVRSSEPTPRDKEGTNRRAVVRELNRMHNIIGSLGSQAPHLTQTEKLQKQFRELKHIQSLIPNTDVLKEVNRSLMAFQKDTNALDALQDTMSNLARFRNQLAHSPAANMKIEQVRPAYSLEEDDDA